MSLERIIQGHEATLLERSSTKAIVSDAFANNIQQVNALMSAYDAGVVKAIEEKHPLSALVRTNLINKLISQYSMNESAATWAIDCWKKVLTKSVIAALAQARTEREATRLEKLKGINEQPTNKPAYEVPVIPEIQFSEDSLSLSTKADIIDFYTNVKLKKVEGKIFIPCGVGTTDNGFYICGIPEVRVSTAPAVYALVYNFLIRNSTILPEDYPHILDQISTTYQINYQRVFRLMMIILQLIKNGQVSRKLHLSYDGQKEELEIALMVINDYVERFSRLIKITPPTIKLAESEDSAIQISLDRKVRGVYIENNTTPCNARELWFGKKINYKLSSKDIRDLEYILGEISPFDSFKEGQFDALISMLNTNGHSMCIMPTGSGKSLIFYFASLLQPLPLMIIAPTEILIDDQIRNLKKFHRMDNVSHLKLTSDNDFSEFYPCTSLLYLTPITFQSVKLIAKCRHINDGYAMIKNKKTKMVEEIHVAPDSSLAYVVLDEVHCLSNWGHDFRPEYLMLSQYLNKYLSRVSFLCFTATANYTVVEDIQKQLNIPQQNIISPITFEKYNISYNFRAVASQDEMFRAACEIVAGLIAKNERTLVFTKSEEDSCRLAEAIGYEADVFEKDNTSAYHMFAEEKCKVLVASEDMGIGINLPNIQNVLHFGLPVSKNEYVQEIGRAGRADEAVTSHVVYLEVCDENVPAVLLRRDQLEDNVAALLQKSENDFTKCFRKLTNNIESKKDLLDKVLTVYTEFTKERKAAYFPVYDLNVVDEVKKYIYMLYVVGFVNNWYAYTGNEKLGTVEIMIDISSNNHEFFSVPQNMLQRVQQKAVAYYDSMGTNREQIVRTQRAKTIETVIDVYVEWYYSKFLYHHKELFLDLLDFIESNKDCDNEKITEDIREYFTLPFVEIKSDEIYYNGLSLSDIAAKVAQGIGRRTLANIERINSNRYAFNLDCMILLGTLKLDARFDKNRFDRVIDNASATQISELKQAFVCLFEKLTPAARLSFVYGVTSHSELFGGTAEEVCTKMYVRCAKDTVYYGLVSRHLNRCFA